MEEEKIRPEEIDQPENPEEPMTELERENQRLREENEVLRLREEYRKTLPLKERLYDKVNVSVKTMDIFIGVMIVLFIVTIVTGLVNR